MHALGMNVIHSLHLDTNYDSLPGRLPRRINVVFFSCLFSHLCLHLLPYTSTKGCMRTKIDLSNHP